MINKKNGWLCNLILTVSVSFLGGCSTFSTEHLSAEGAKGSGFCVKGGYAMAGGVVTGAKVNEGFKGNIVVQPDCGIAIFSE